MYEDFKEDFKEKYSKEEFDEVDNLIGESLENSSSHYISGKRWNLSCDIEKIHQLQYTYYIALSKEIINSYDEEVSLEFENGIENGTLLRDYNVDGGSTPSDHYTVNVLHDLEIDWDEVNINSIIRTGKKPLANLVKQMFNYHKDSILEIYKKENYDNYVTGGGTNVTQQAYKGQKAKYNDMGLYWTLIYKDIEADRQFV